MRKLFEPMRRMLDLEVALHAGGDETKLSGVVPRTCGRWRPCLSIEMLPEIDEAEKE
jgi:hypothetical protein